MDALFQRGVLVQIRSSMWSMEVNLDARDIDVNDSDLPDFVRLGYKRLFPKDTRNVFSRISGRSRAQADRYGFGFFLTGAYFVPNDALGALLPQLEASQLEYMNAVEEFLYKYEAAKVSFLNTYPDHRAHLAPFYPSVDELRSKFSFNVWCYRMGSSPAVPIGQFGSISEDDYITWATSAVNELRDEARVVARDIGKAIGNDELNGRNLRKVKSLVDRLATMDLLEDQDLLRAAKNLQTSQTGNAAKALASKAKAVTNVRVRKLLLD